MALYFNTVKMTLFEYFNTLKESITHWSDCAYSVLMCSNLKKKKKSKYVGRSYAWLEYLNFKGIVS